MSEATPAERPPIYRITVLGRLGRDWLPCFAGLAAACDGEVTILTGPVADQAALRGLLCWLWDLNLTLLCVVRLEQDPGRERTSSDDYDDPGP